MTKDQLNKFRLSLYIYLYIDRLIFTCFGVSVKKGPKTYFRNFSIHNMNKE